MGSKQRHAADLIAVTCANRKQGQCYVEPFVGGGNVICKVPQAQGPRIANDLNWRMVALLDAAGNKGWRPPEVMTRTLWTKIKNKQDDYPPELVAFAATACCFGSSWFSAYIIDLPDTAAKNRDYEAVKRAFERDGPGLEGVIFHSLSYSEFTPHIPPESIIYCDPPYTGTTGYAGAKTIIKIDEALSKNNWKANNFWKWADALVTEGHRVYVSEYKGPSSAIYSGLTPELKDKIDPLRAAYRASAADPTSPPSVREQLSFRIANIETHIQAGADAQAARWKCLWEKEVTSDFSAVRTEDNSGKREIERLFHREP